MILTGSLGFIVRRAFQGALFFAGSAGSLMMGNRPAPKPILETSLLVFPNNPVAGAGEVPRASDFRATVGKVEFEVRSVTAAAGSSDLKTAIVFDLASIPPDYQPCLIRQARAMAPELRRRRNLALFVASYEWTEFHKPFGYGSGETYEYFLPELNAASKDACASLPPPRPQYGWSRGWSERARTDPGFRGGYWELVYAALSTCQSFRGLADALQSEHGPIQVFWVGQRFEWVHPGYADTRKEYEDVVAGRRPWEPGYTPNAAYGWLDAFTRAGINFWPVVWLDGESEHAEGPKISRKYASEIAQYLGGRASVCDTDLAACLKNLLETSSQGWIVRISGPEVDWPVSYTAQILNLWYQPDRGVLDVKRPFVRLEKPRVRSARILAWHTVAPSVPLFDSAWLSGKAGCDTGPRGRAKKYAMTALVPDAVVRGLRTYVEVLSVSPGPPDKKLTAQQERAAILGEHTQLHTRSAPQLLRETGQGTAEICVDLPPTSQTDGSYRVIVFNPEAGWAGVGVVPVADVVGNREQP
jgi:hypothetical protein